jgi:hypothetical protein
MSIVINAVDGTLEDGTLAQPDDLAKLESWRVLFEQGGRKMTKRMFVCSCLSARSAHAFDLS